MGPVRVVVGAEGKLGTVSVETRPPELGVGKVSYPEAEVGASEQTVSWHSGMERHLDAIYTLNK